MARHFGIPRREVEHDANGDMQAAVIGVLAALAILALLAVAFLASMLLFSFPAGAHDPTGYWAREIAAGRAPDVQWWTSLTSGKGPCCSGADGRKVEDVDWESKDGHYRVLFKDVVIDGTPVADGWIDVPDDAVVHDPNRYGPAVVWPYLTWAAGPKPTAAIRCFLPGAGT